MSNESRSRTSPTRNPSAQQSPLLTNFFVRDYAQQMARNLVHDGFFAYRRADYARAESCFRDALVCDPANQIAKKYVILFDAVNQGKREYDDALSEKANGSYLKAQQHLESAKQNFQRALSIDPDFPQAKIYLLRALSSEGFDKLARGDYEMALFIFRQIFHFDPGYNSAYVPLIHLLTLKGKIALERKELDVAEQLFAEASEVDKFSNPTQSLEDSLTQELRQQLVELYIQQALRKEDDPRAALGYLKKALIIDRYNSRALLYSGECYEELGKPMQAKQCYQIINEETVDGLKVSILIERVMERHKRHDGLLKKSEKLQKKREFEKATAALNEILDDCSEHVDARFRLDEIERAKEKHAKNETVRVTYVRHLRSSVWQTNGSNTFQPDNSHKRQRNGK